MGDTFIRGQYTKVLDSGGFKVKFTCVVSNPGPSRFKCSVIGPTGKVVHEGLGGSKMEALDATMKGFEPQKHKTMTIDEAQAEIERLKAKTTAEAEPVAKRGRPKKEESATTN